MRGCLTERSKSRLDRLTAVLALPLLVALWLPVLDLRANRIAPATGYNPAEVSGALHHAAILAVGLMLLAALLYLRRPALRLAILTMALLALAVMLGHGAQIMMTDQPPAARVAPGEGFWLALVCLVLLLIDAIARLPPGIGIRALLLAGAIGLSVVVLASGLLADLSIFAEYRARAHAFQRAAIDHVILAFGSFLAAMVIGLPMGLAIQRRPSVRGPVLNVLTLIQTIPSIALFGMLIVPLAWAAANVPGVSQAGISGIGTAPALIALFLYSLLPIVANTVAGIDAVPRAVRDAAAGMGMTSTQRMAQVNLPLALPVILAGIRIVLVQNIGLAAVGALIGSGGFGIFIFQGIGQTATDLILLGVLPIVAMAFLTSAVLDLLIALAQARRA